MLASSEVKTFLSFSFNKKKKARLSSNSALNKKDFANCGWDEIKNEKIGSVNAIKKEFFFEVWIRATTNEMRIGSR